VSFRKRARLKDLFAAPCGAISTVETEAPQTDQPFNLPIPFSGLWISGIIQFFIFPRGPSGGIQRNLF
jgi:hypothetical protein